MPEHTCTSAGAVVAGVPGGHDAGNGAGHVVDWFKQTRGALAVLQPPCVEQSAHTLPLEPH
jgi:hypothetical protein